MAKQAEGMQKNPNQTKKKQKELKKKPNQVQIYSSINEQQVGADVPSNLSAVKEQWAGGYQDHHHSAGASSLPCPTSGPACSARPGGLAHLLDSSAPKLRSRYSFWSTGLTVL